MKESDSLQQCPATEVAMGRRKHFSTVRVVKLWNSLPRGTVVSPALLIFKTQMDAEQPALADPA